MKLDLNKGVNLLIEGELCKFQTIPIKLLSKLSDSLQSIIYTVATSEINISNKIILSNFNIELSGFKGGSAIPQFKYTQNIQYDIIDDPEKQRNIVNNKFDELMEICDSGNFLSLKNIYTQPIIRNNIISSLYNFTNSVNGSKLTFVDFDRQENIRKVFKVNKIQPEIRKELFVEIIKNSEELFEPNLEAIARIKITDQKGKKFNKPQIEEFFDIGIASLDYSPTVIKYENRIYHLQHPLRCKLEKEEDHYLIESELLDIVATGKTMDDAINDFSEEFDYCYERYNELDDNNLSNRIKNIKLFLNNFVVGVENVRS